MSVSERANGTGWQRARSTTPSTSWLPRTGQPGRRLDPQFGELRVQPRIGEAVIDENRRAIVDRHRCVAALDSGERSPDQLLGQPDRPECRKLPRAGGLQDRHDVRGEHLRKSEDNPVDTIARGAGSLRMVKSRFRRVVSPIAVRYSASGPSLMRRSGPRMLLPACSMCFAPGT